VTIKNYIISVTITYFHLWYNVDLLSNMLLIRFSISQPVVPILNVITFVLLPFYLQDHMILELDRSNYKLYTQFSENHLFNYFDIF